MKQRILALLLVALPAILWAQTAQPETIDDSPKTYEIGGIKVVGAHHSQPQAIIALSGLKVGNKVQVPGPSIPGAIKALWKQRLFSDVQIIKTKAISNVLFLEIRVVEMLRVAKVVIKGLKKIEQEEAQDLVYQHVIKGTIFTKNDKANLQSALLKHFEEKGFYHALINIEEQADSLEGKLYLTLKIEKGQKAKVKAVHFAGNNNIRASKLQKIMATKSSKRFLSSARFAQSNYEADKQTIIDYYHSEGYRDMAFAEDRIDINEQGDLEIYFEITEGSRYYFRNITWKGNAIYPTEVLEKVLGIKKGDVYNTALLEQRLRFDAEGRDISSLYMDNGYLFFQVDPLEKAIVGDSIDLEIRILEGPAAIIDKVTISGNERTHEEVIRRELRTKPGQRFSRTDIIRSQREIISLGYFNPETLDIQTEVNPEKGTVNIEYVLEEKRNDQIELSAGWQPGASGEKGSVVGTLGFTLNNFSFRNLLTGQNWSPFPSGDGQVLSLRLQSTGKSYQAYNLSFTEPWLGGKSPNTLSVAGFYQRYTNGYSPDTESYQSLAVVGGTVRFGSRLKALNQNLIATTELSFQNIDLNGYRSIILDDGTALDQGSFNNLYLKQTLTYNTIADPFFPRQGLRASISGQWTPPYSLFRDEVANPEGVNRWLEYHKWRFDVEGYLPVVGKLTFKGSLKLGTLGTYNSEMGTPPFERFELGGDGISSQQSGFVGNDVFALRGYEADYLKGTQNGGGAAFSKIAAELRYPVLNTPMARAYILAFAEGGNVWKDPKDLNPFDIKRSAGMGLRIHLPMFGTLGFDYGIGFDKPELAGQKWTNYGTFNVILGFEPE